MGDKKGVFIVLLLGIFVFGLVGGNVYAGSISVENDSSFFSAQAGSGSISDPYIITNCLQLQNMSNNLSANYALGANIDCSDTVTWNGGLGFLPIGNSTNSYNGSLFDGRGYNITGFYHYNNDRSDKRKGLFGNVTSSSFNITNVGMKDTIIRASGAGSFIGRFSGGSLYINNSFVENCQLNSTYNTGSLGGFVGSLYRFNGDIKIENSWISGELFGFVGTGGFVGSIYQFSGDPSASFSIDKSYSTASIYDLDYPGDYDGYYLGGFLGRCSTQDYDIVLKVNISNSNLSNSQLLGASCVGGFIGRCRYSSNGVYIHNSHVFNSRIDGWREDYLSSSCGVGGFIGEGKIDEISDSFVSGTELNGWEDEKLGGFVGHAWSDINISRSYVEADIYSEDTDHVGGLLGYSDNVLINQSFFKGEISIIGDSYVNAGCLVGFSNSQGYRIYDAYAECNISSSGRYTGGLIGRSVTGSNVLQNSYFKGNVVGGNHTGGFVGSTFSDSGSTNVTNCFFVGNVSSMEGNEASLFYAGSLSESNLVLNNVYWNNVSGNPGNCYYSLDGYGDTGCTEIGDNESYFRNYDNPPMNLREGGTWDFFNVWFGDSNGDSYPPLISLGNNVGNPPQITISSPSSDTGYSAASVDLDFEYNFTDASLVDNCSVYLLEGDGVVYSENDSSVNNTEGAINNFTISEVLEGTYTAYVNCTDIYGYEGKSTEEIIITIAVPPAPTTANDDSGGWSGGGGAENIPWTCGEWGECVSLGASSNGFDTTNYISFNEGVANDLIGGGAKGSLMQRLFQVFLEML